MSRRIDIAGPILLLLDGAAQNVKMKEVPVSDCCFDCNLILVPTSPSHVANLPHSGVGWHGIFKMQHSLRFCKERNVNRWS